MPLADQTQPMLGFDPEKSTVTLVVVCHCGEQFSVDQLDEAQAHVKGHLTAGS